VPRANYHGLYLNSFWKASGPADYLTAHGVNFLQGYLFGRPMPGADFINALSHH
jgi:hypothetical protein